MDRSALLPANRTRGERVLLVGQHVSQYTQVFGHTQLSSRVVACVLAVEIARLRCDIEVKHPNTIEAQAFAEVKPGAKVRSQGIENNGVSQVEVSLCIWQTGSHPAPSRESTRLAGVLVAL